MNKDEALKVLSILRDVFPNGKAPSKVGVNAMIEALVPYDLDDTLPALRRLIDEWDAYIMPTVGALIKRIKVVRLEKLTDADTLLALRNEADKMLKKGTSLTSSDFSDAPMPIQIFFGDMSRVRQLALMPAYESDKELERFLKELPSIIEKLDSDERKKKLGNVETFKLLMDGFDDDSDDE